MEIEGEFLTIEDMLARNFSKQPALNKHPATHGTRLTCESLNMVHDEDQDPGYHQVLQLETTPEKAGLHSTWYTSPSSQCPLAQGVEVWRWYDVLGGHPDLWQVIATCHIQFCNDKVLPSKYCSSSYYCTTSTILLLLLLPPLLLLLLLLLLLNRPPLKRPLAITITTAAAAAASSSCSSRAPFLARERLK